MERAPKARPRKRKKAVVLERDLVLVAEFLQLRRFTPTRLKRARFTFACRAMSTLRSRSKTRPPELQDFATKHRLCAWIRQDAAASCA